MKNFNKTMIILIILASIFWVYKLNFTAEAGNKLSLSEKLDLLITKQKDTLIKLDNIYDELIKVKIRVSKKL